MACRPATCSFPRCRSGGTTMKLQGIPVPPVPLYRVSGQGRWPRQHRDICPSDAALSAPTGSNETTTPATPLSRRDPAAFVALTMSFRPMAPGAYAATTTLTDQPIAAKVAAKPNIIYTLDDSGSMALTYIPDYVSEHQPHQHASGVLPQQQRPDEPTSRAVTDFAQSRLRRADVRVGVQQALLQPEHPLRRRRWTAMATRRRWRSPTAPAAPTS